MAIRQSYLEAKQVGFDVPRGTSHDHDWVKDTDTWVEAYFCARCGEYQVD